MWVWEVFGQQARSCLRHVAPHLKHPKKIARASMILEKHDSFYRHPQLGYPPDVRADIDAYESAFTNIQ